MEILSHLMKRIITSRAWGGVSWTGMSTFILLLVWGCGPNRTTPVRITLEGDDYRSAPAAPIRPSRPVSQGNGDSLAPAGWIPARRVEDKDRWEGIIVHHSGTVSGNAALIDKWHKQQGWDGLGYHFVIDNGQGGADGRLEVGFRWRDQLTGAHCREATGDDNYWNEHTIGICLVGNFEEHRPTASQ